MTPHEGARVLLTLKDGSKVHEEIAYVYEDGKRCSYYNVNRNDVVSVEPDTSPVSPQGTGEAELARILRRYGPVEPPKCRLCGAAMDLHGSGPDGTSWYCSAVKYIVGTKAEQEHFSRSHEHVYRHGDEDVVNLVASYRAVLDLLREVLPYAESRAEDLVAEVERLEEATVEEVVCLDEARADAQAACAKAWDAVERARAATTRQGPAAPRVCPDCGGNGRRGADERCDSCRGEGVLP